MALVTRYVNTASTPGGDGTTNGTTGATRAYASLNEWEAAEQTDLVTATDVHKVICSGGVDSAVVTIDGWTTNSTYYIIVTVDSGSRHNGSLGTGYRLEVSENYGGVYIVRETGTITEGLSVLNSGTTSGRCFDVGSGAQDDIMYVNCIGKTVSTGGSATTRFVFKTQAGDLTYINCLAFDSARGFTNQNYNQSYYINCHAINCDTGFSGRTTGGQYPHAINCVAFGCTNNYSGGWDDANSYNNATGDATVGTMPGTDGGTNEATLVTGIVSGDFENYASDNFFLSSSSNLIDVGASVSSLFSTWSRTDFTIPDADVIGTARPQGSAWDIGYNERIAGAVSRRIFNIS